MASLLGSLASGLGQGIGQMAQVREENNRRTEDKKFQVNMDKRRAEREKKLAEWRVSQRKEMAEQDREFRSGMADKEYGRRMTQAGIEGQLKKEAAQTTANAESQQARIDSLNERMSGIDQTRLSLIEDAAKGSGDGLIEGAGPRLSLTDADYQLMQSTMSTLSNFSEQEIKAAGYYNTYLSLKQILSQAAPPPNQDGATEQTPEPPYNPDRAAEQTGSKQSASQGILQQGAGDDFTMSTEELYDFSRFLNE